MSNCTFEPMVNNAVATLANYTSELVMATYQCLTGFSMSGTSRIFCNSSEGNWDDPPRCYTVNSDVNVNVSANSGAVGEWFYYFLAVIIVIALIASIITCVWCYCCPPCRQYAYYQEPVVYERRVRWNQSEDDVKSIPDKKDPIFWVEKSDQTPREAPVYRKPSVPARDLVREGLWLPHRNSVRNINTSTK